MLFKGFTTTMAAIAIAFASFSATPAKADNDTAKIIAGVAALAIIGAAIADNRDRRYVTRHHGQYYNPYYGHQRKVYRQHHYNKHHYYKKHHYGHVHSPKHHRKHW